MAESLLVHSWRKAGLDTAHSTELFLPLDFLIWSKSFALHKKINRDWLINHTFSRCGAAARCQKKHVTSQMPAHRICLPAQRIPKKHRIQSNCMVAVVSWDLYPRVFHIKTHVWNHPQSMRLIIIFIRNCHKKAEVICLSPFVPH